jgi:hypothetical protein
MSIENSSEKLDKKREEAAKMFNSLDIKTLEMFVAGDDSEIDLLDITPTTGSGFTFEDVQKIAEEVLNKRKGGN